MEVDNVQNLSPEIKDHLLKRAIATVTRATEQDLERMYADAVTLYDSALHDFDRVVSSESSQVVRDCVMAKMDAYAHRSDTLKKFLSRSRSPSSDGGSLGAAEAESDAAETRASSDSGVETTDDGAHTSHDLSADSSDNEPGYATIGEPRRHQQRSRQQFLDACAEQVEQLLHIIRDEREPEEIRDRARRRCEQILDFAEAYRRDFLTDGAATAGAADDCSDAAADAAADDAAADDAADDDVYVPAPLVARTVSVASSVAAADPLLTGHLVHAEVLLSADQHDAETDINTDEPTPPPRGVDVGEACPEPPVDGDEEFPLTFSVASLRFADAESTGSYDSPDYATVRRATPSPRKHLSQSSLNRIETETEPLLGDGEPRATVAAAAAVAAARPAKDSWWRRRRRGSDPEPEPMERGLAEPSMFWVLLGSLCG